MRLEPKELKWSDINYFKKQEFYRSPAASAAKIPNVCLDPVKAADIDMNLRRLCWHVLDPLRNWVQRPIVITSGYRTETINRIVGGVPTSNHTKGYAADITIYPYDTTTIVDMYNYILRHMDYDECLIYPKRHFIHVSYKSLAENRGKCGVMR